MSRGKAPAFQWYPADILSDAEVMLMTMEEEGCYRRLIDVCWLEGGRLPADPAVLSGLCKGATITERVLSKFKKDPKNHSKIFHKRLEKERKKQASWRKKCSLGGLRSAHKRKHPKEKPNKQGSTTTPPSKNRSLVELKGNTSSSSSSSSSSSNNIYITKPRKKCPENFQITEDLKKWAAREVPGLDIEFQTKKFKDHEFAKTYTHWCAVWRNWMRTALERMPGAQQCKPEPDKVGLNDDNSTSTNYSDEDLEIIEKNYGKEVADRIRKKQSAVDDVPF